MNATRKLTTNPSGNACINEVVLFIRKKMVNLM
jgi:hypothetical protein